MMRWTMAVVVGLALAASLPAAAGEAVVVAQAAAGRPGAAAEEPLAERVEALEKETIVLREDLGKARVDARAELAASDRRHAEAMARMQQRIDELNSRFEEERERQERRNRHLWIALAIVATVALVAD